MAPSPAAHASSDGPLDPSRGWRILVAELSGIVVATLGGAAFGTLLGPPGIAGGALLGALVGGSSVAAGRAGQRYGWSTAPHAHPVHAG